MVHYTKEYREYLIWGMYNIFDLLDYDISSLDMEDLHSIMFGLYKSKQNT